MKQRMETKDAAHNAWDPLFTAYFDNVKDINLECNSSDQDVRCFRDDTVLLLTDDRINSYPGKVSPVTSDTNFLGGNFVQP